MTRAKTFLGAVRACSHAVLGIPSYEGYLDHMRERHPEAAPMTRPQFFRDRQGALFGEGRSGPFRCC